MIDRLKSVAIFLTREAVVRALFDHVRNLILSSAVIAVGLQAIRSDTPDVLVPYPSTAGYVVTSVGVLLLLINFADGLRKLSTLKFGRYLQGLMVALYAMLSWRVFQMILVFH